MYTSICLSPSIFEDKLNLSNIKNLIEKIQLNGFLLIDDDEFLIKKYKESILKIKNLNEDEKIISRILLETIESKMDTNLSYFGNINSESILLSLYKKIKSLKIVKFINTKEYYEIKNRIDYFYFIVSKSLNEDESIKKQKYSEFIEDIDFSRFKFTLNKQINGKNISNKTVDDICLNWVAPIVWNTKSLQFFSKDISTNNPLYKKTSRNSFKKYAEEIIKLLIKINSNYKNVEILIITGSNKEDWKELEIELNDFLIVYFRKKYSGINIKLIFKRNKEDIELLHDRCIVSENVCIKFSKNPQIMQECYNEKCGFLNFYSYQDKFKQKLYCKECKTVLEYENDILYFSSEYNSLTRDINYLPEAKKLTKKLLS